MTAVATVKASVYKKAESQEQASTWAIEEARSGNVHWVYDGTDDSTIEVNCVTPTEKA